MAQGRDDFILNGSVAMSTSWGEEFMVIEMTVYLPILFEESYVFLLLS
jgi:hypothetical protein